MVSCRPALSIPFKWLCCASGFQASPSASGRIGHRRSCNEVDASAGANCLCPAFSVETGAGAMSRKSGSVRLDERAFYASLDRRKQFPETAYAAMPSVDSEKLMIVCFSCRSTSSAIVITSVSNRLKSTVFRLICRVWNKLTCNIRDSSIIIGME
jgi:hypothetical protein